MRKILASCLILWLMPQWVNAACNPKIPEYFDYTDANGQKVERFTKNQDGTAKDNMTGLTWMRCNVGANWNSTEQTCDDGTFGNTAKKTTWPGALIDAVNDINNQDQALGESREWRLPNIKELGSIVYRHCTDPMISTSTFINPQASYWSSTPTMVLIDTEIAVEDPNNPGKTQTDEATKEVITERKQVDGAWTMSFKIGRAERKHINPLQQVNKSYVRLVHD